MFIRLLASAALVVFLACPLVASSAPTYTYLGVSFQTLAEAEDAMKLNKAPWGQFLEPCGIDVFPNTSILNYCVKPKPPEFLRTGYIGALHGDCQPSQPITGTRCLDPKDDNPLTEEYPRPFYPGENAVAVDAGTDMYPGCSWRETGRTGGYSIPPLDLKAYPLDGGAAYWILATHTNASVQRGVSYVGEGQCAGVVRSITITGNNYWRCPPGFTVNENLGAWPDVCQAGTATITKSDDGAASTCPATGFPCVPGTGEKLLNEPDFTWSGYTFTRHYRSLSEFPIAAGFGHSWTHSLAMKLKMPFGANPAYVHHFDERNAFEEFKPVSGMTGVYRASGTPGRILTKQADSTWILAVNDGALHHFDSTGRLKRIEYVDDPSRTLLLEHGVHERLERVTSGLGRRLTFRYRNATYDVAGNFLPERLTLIEDDAGTVLASYAYDASQRLQQVSYPGGAQRNYHWAEADHVCIGATGSCQASFFPRHITGITDEKGVRFTNYYYDRNGRAVRSVQAGGANDTLLTYPTDLKTVVTLPSGGTRTYDFDTSIYRRPTSVQLKEAGGALIGTETFQYDVSNTWRKVTNHNGVTTKRTFDTRGLELERIDAESKGAQTNLPEKRTTATTWTGANPRRLAVERRNAAGTAQERTTFAYNARGQVFTRTAIDPANSAQRVTTFAYCEQIDVDAPSSTCPILGLLKSVDGPRTDVSDVASYSYRAADAANCASQPAQCTYRKGDLWKVTNAAGHVIEYLSYDLAGRVTSLKDANGVVTDMEYHARGWLTARKVRGPNGSVETDDAITRIDYDATGQVTKVTQPDGAFLSYTYDGAHRLTDITDNAGNTIHYTLDAAGNRVKEDSKDPGGTVTRTLARQADTLGRIKSLLRAPYADLPNLDDPSAKKTSYTFDANGNVDLTTDPLARVTDNEYDPLDRLIKTIGDKGAGKINATTQYQYDARDNLVKVIDPKGLSTDYTYNGFSDLTQLSSPDTGITTYTYDSAGNRATQTDARGITSTMSYDALNRLTGITYPTASENVAFYYDQIQPECGTEESFALGRMTRMTDESGETRYCYDRRGNVTRKVQVTDGETLAVQYGHDAADRLATLTYPSGAIVTYSRDALGRIVGVTHKVDAGSAPTTVVSNVTYRPFGPVGTITFGNGRTLTKTWDKNYAIDAIATVPANGLNHDFTVDDVGNIVGITGGATRNYTYDNLDRLTTVKDENLALIEAFAYDATGNRTSKQVGTNPAQTYTYPANSHRLASVGGVARTYDANGNTTSDGVQAFVYDDRNRLASAAGEVYRHSGKGERVAKDAVRFVYDEGGKLLAETAGAATDYVWFDQMLVGIARGNAVALVETDHLGTTRAVVEVERSVPVWSWSLTQSVFGEHGPNVDPDGDTELVTLGMRFPGQYADSATGLNYNYFRDYEPQIGKYIEADPIGVDGGIALYGYALDNPLTNTDVLGLDPLMDCLVGGDCSGTGMMDPDQPMDTNRCGVACDQADAYIQTWLGFAAIGTAAMSAGVGGASSGAGAGAARYAQGLFRICRNFRCQRPEVHNPHHFFRFLGRNGCHLQVNCYVKGMKGSNIELRIPYPCDRPAPPGFRDRRGRLGR